MMNETDKYMKSHFLVGCLSEEKTYGYLDSGSTWRYVEPVSGWAKSYIEDNEVPIDSTEVLLIISEILKE